jgi:hypothetical protein
MPRRLALQTILAAALLALIGHGCHGCRLDDAPAYKPDRPFDHERDCVSAYYPRDKKAQAVFAETGHPGGGPTWETMLLHVIDEHASRGPEEVHAEMGIGTQYSVVFRGRRSWFGYDTEGDGTVFCTPMTELRTLLADTYERASRDPEALRELIRSTTFLPWDE